MKKYNNVNLVIAIMIFLVTVVSLFYLPDCVPTHTHFNTVDGWGSKYTNLIAPVLAFALWYFMPIFMKQKAEHAKLLGDIAGSAYLTKNKNMINVIFMIFAYLDLYWIYQDFEYTSSGVSISCFLLIAIAMFYVMVSFVVYFMSKEELLKLHWKEFQPEDTPMAIMKKQRIFLISGCIVGLLILGDAMYSTVSISFIIVVTGLILLKLLSGMLKRFRL